MKQTAVDYLWHDLIANPGNYIKAYQKAKAMEKEQIIKAVYDSMGTNFDPNMGRAEQYYKEKYGK